MNEIRPQELLDLIKSSKQYTLTRHMVLDFQLFLEHYVNEIITLFAQKPLHKELREFSFLKKVKILEKMNVINSAQKEALKSISEFRDIMVHSLALTQKEANSKLANLNFYCNLEVKPEGRVINLEEEYKKWGFNKLDQFQTTAALLAVHLYTELKGLKKEQLDQYFSPTFRKNELGAVECHINLMVFVKKPSQKF